MSRRVAAALVAALVVAACSSTGPNRDPAELTKIEKPALKTDVAWDKSPTGGGGDLHTGLRLAVEEDMVVSADTSGEVAALNPQTGDKLWRVDTKARVIAGPSITGNLVVVGTTDAEVIALKRATGEQLWKATVSSSVVGAPVGAGNTLVVRCVDGKVFGLAADTGVRRWSFARENPELMLRGQSAPLVEGSTVFMGLDNGHAVALKLDTGEVLWEQIVSAPTGRNPLERISDVDADPVMANEGLFAASFGGDLAALNPADGRVAWRSPVRSFTGIAVLANRLFVTDQDGVVWAFDFTSGASVWKQEALKYRRLSPPTVQSGYIAVGDLEGYVHWLSPDDGHIVARVKAVNDAVRAPMVLRDDTLYVLSRAGKIAAVKVGPAPAEPKHWWSSGGG